MALFRKRFKALLIIVGVAFIVLAFVEVTIPYLGQLWHLTHNPDVSLGEYSFAVPEKYFLSHYEGRLVFVRFSPVVPVVSKRSSITGAFATQNLIGIYRHGGKAFDKNNDYQRMKEWLTDQGKQTGMRLESEKTLSSQLGSGYCFEFGGAQVFEVRCFFSGSTFTVVFDGERRFADDLYKVIADARRRPSVTVGWAN